MNTRLLHLSCALHAVNGCGAWREDGARAVAHGSKDVDIFDLMYVH